MSVPDFTGDVKRATRLVVRGLEPVTGRELIVATDAFEARCLQHELDHLVRAALPRPGRRGRTRSTRARRTRRAARAP